MTKSDIEKYFNAEKSESLIFILIGVLAIIIALICLFVIRSAFSRGMAIPLIAIAFIQIAVGYTVWRRSDAQRTDIVYAFDMDRNRLKADEVPRMSSVMKNFTVYRWVEISLACTGLFLFFYFRSLDNGGFWRGIGLALFIQSIIMLLADFFAERRGREYLDDLIKMLS